MRHHLFAHLLAAASLAVAGLACDTGDAAETEASAVPSAGSTAASADVLPADLLLAAAPAEAKGVSEVRGSAAEGDRVVMKGVVAGREDPISENRAIFTLVDESIRTCDTTPTDECATPWDACCEPQDVIADNAAAVQVTDADGRPLKTGLAGLGDLKPLSRVVVVGTFAPSPDGKAATVNATGIHVVN